MQRRAAIGLLIKRKRSNPRPHRRTERSHHRIGPRARCHIRQLTTGNVPLHIATKRRELAVTNAVSEQTRKSGHRHIRRHSASKQIGEDDQWHDERRAWRTEIARRRQIAQRRDVDSSVHHARAGDELRVGRGQPERRACIPKLARQTVHGLDDSSGGLSNVAPGATGSQSSSGAGNSDGNGGNSRQGGNTSSRAPGDTFSLIVHVVRGSSTTDTSGGPVSGAAVRISKNVWTFIHGNGGDTISGADVDVATGGTDANGDIRFEKLSPDLYRIQADGPTGSGLASRWVKQELLHVANVRVPLVLTKAP